MPEPDGPGDERFVCVVTVAGVEAVREGAVVADSGWEAAVAGPQNEQRQDTLPATSQD